MKNLLILITVILAFNFTSCKKATSPYSTKPDSVDTTQWQSQYNNGGTIPTVTTVTNGDLFGTNWILTKVQIGLASTIKNDTIHFIDNTHYKVNNNPLLLTYSLYQSGANKTLTLNNFMPVNGYNCSGMVGVTFVTYGQIIGVEFKDLYNSNNKFNLWFTKI